MPGELQQQMDRLQPMRDGGLAPDASERLIDQVNTSLRDNRVPRGAAEYVQAVDQLRTQGVLPNLLIQEFDRIDNNRDGRVSESEMQRVIQARNLPFLTGVAARGLRGTLREMGGDIDPHSGEYSVTRNRYEAFLRARQQPAAPEERREQQNRTPEPAPQAEARARTEAEARARIAAQSDRRSRTEEQTSPAAQRQIDVLQSGRGTPQERLAAVAELARLGISSISLTDSNGDRINCRIQVSRVAPNSDRNYVHLYARQENGREQVMLRGLEQNGQISQQVRTDGTAAAYTGDVWTRNRPTSILARRS